MGGLRMGGLRMGGLRVRSPRVGDLYIGDLACIHASRWYAPEPNAGLLASEMRANGTAFIKRF